MPIVIHEAPQCSSPENAEGYCTCSYCGAENLKWLNTHNVLNSWKLWNTDGTEHNCVERKNAMYKDR